ncbi:fumarylacetoacetate hydrolase family protein [Aminobacter sp. HY435]|uniref:fumarylacetoacetate hydrolase family protein n=1 Tax=Aminobacter sp. HY435 TaxID=2970917 RepID=UPI003FA4416B
MATFVITPPDPASVAVAGSPDRFPVRRIFCVGRNYAAHAREMGNDPDREPPFFFGKPADAVVDSGTIIPYPPLTESLHYEVELVVAIGRGGVNIDATDALGHVWGYGVGIDFTRRDLQDTAKKMGRPWDWAKGFDRSAPCGPLVRAADIGHPSAGRIWLSVNGESRQQGDLAELIWTIPEVIAICSQSMELKAGDLIYTGTPAGVGAVTPGDRIAAGVDGVGEIAIAIANPR